MNNNAIKTLSFNQIYTSVRRLYIIMELCHKIDRREWVVEDLICAIDWQSNLIKAINKIDDIEEKINQNDAWRRYEISLRRDAYVEEHTIKDSALQEQLIVAENKFEELQEIYENRYKDTNYLYRQMVEELIWYNAKYKCYREVPWF